jgi:DNA polymerase-3 subunit gamma/tau
MEYQVLARKWRPQQFDEVVGQEHVTATLTNAIAKGRVAHAYIFTGPRGIGKTSTARILAKALNCAKGPTPAPCDRCPSCAGIIAGNSMDVLEIDGASNRGIEEIRTLRENVKFAPTAGKYKIYIIDEVHQITDPAFNALLKTLEEPPAHVKFFFATTEPHKVPATILSRCQRFDLRGISPAEIVERLRHIAKTEKISIDEEACFAIARYAQGSMRDAESILDQLVSFSEGKIGEGDVIAMLGLVKESVLHDMTDALISGDCRRGLELIAAVVGEGKELPLFLADWIGYLRAIMLVLVVGGEENAAGVSKESWKAILAQSTKVSPDQMLYMMDVLTKADQQMKYSLSPRILMEMAFLKAARAKEVASVADILKRIRALESSLSGGGENPGPQPSAGGADRAQEPRGAAGKEAPLTYDHAPPPPSAPFQADAAVGAKVAEAPAQTAVPAEDPGIVDRVRELWHDIVERVAVVRPLLRPYLIEGTPSRFADGILIVEFSEDSSHHRDYLDQARNKGLVKKVISERMERDMGIRFEARKKAVKDNGRPKQQAAPPKEVKSLKKDPLIQSALEMFQAQVMEVKK